MFLFVLYHACVSSSYRYDRCHRYIHALCFRNCFSVIFFRQIPFDAPLSQAFETVAALARALYVNCHAHGIIHPSGCQHECFARSIKTD